MTTGRMVELAAAVALLAVGVVLYRRPRDNADKADTYGSQGAVLLFVVSAIMGIHALGGLDYHPSKAEADLIRERAKQQ